MNNLFEKGATWILIIIAILAMIAIGVWFLPWVTAVKVIVSIIFGCLAGLGLFVGLFMSGPQ